MADSDKGSSTGENEGEGEGEGIAWVLGGYACERLWVAVNEGASERG